MVYDDGFAWNVHDKTTSVCTLTAPNGRKVEVYLGVNADYYHILHTDLVFRKLHDSSYPRQDTWMDAITADDVGRLQEIFAAHPDQLNPRNAVDTPLLSATFLDKADVVSSLIHEGADVNLANNVGQTPLMRAANFGKLDIARILTDAGADVKKKDDFGNTALSEAIQINNKDIIALLRQRGATK